LWAKVCEGDHGAFVRFSTPRRGGKKLTTADTESTGGIHFPRIFTDTR
jgi:hypothetical protein